MQIWMTPFLACAILASPQAQDAQTRSDTTVQKITIKYSGFLKDEEFTIRFKKENYDIVEVLSSGRAVPADSFYVYGPLLHDYLHFRGLENVVPRIEKLKREIARRKAVDSTRIREAIRIERALDSLDVRFSLRADSLADHIHHRIRVREKEMDSERRRMIRETERMSDHISRELRRELADVREELEYKLENERDRLKMIKENMNAFLDDLLQEGLITSKEGITIEHKKGVVRINGRKLNKEETEKVKALWNKHLDRPFEESENAVIKL